MRARTPSVPRLALLAAITAATAAAQTSATPPGNAPAEQQGGTTQQPVGTAQQPGGVPGTQQPNANQSLPTTEPASAKIQGLQMTFGEWTAKLGGYVKVDFIHDFNAIGSTDSFDPRTIPTDDQTGVNNRVHARQTRLNLDVRGPTEIGPLRVFVEGDFFGTGNAFRMRHAYGTIEGLLAGQTWSTFMDEDTMPETLDFESPIAFPLIRQGQIRYTHDFGEGSYAAIAIEDPASSIIAPPVPGHVEEATPDLTGRLRWKHGLGHTQLGLFAGSARYNPDAGDSDTAFLWGINLSTKLDVCERDALFVQVTWGDGVGRYRGGITAAPDANGDLEPVEVFAAMLGFEHHWSDELRSTITYSWGDADVPAGAGPDAVEVLEYLAANLIWQFTSKTYFGVEYLYGAREDVDDARGEAHRLQMSVRFSF